jgi:hypothetical protein
VDLKANYYFAISGNKMIEALLYAVAIIGCVDIAGRR